MLRSELVKRLEAIRCWLPRDGGPAVERAAAELKALLEDIAREGVVDSSWLPSGVLP